ncbi:fluoride efflux transporter CrcB [Maribacter polysiphoniae]|uniref:Fluoride-specific ion channel FluC n=2 Tax=Maribacter TaxID=252356 RepID=A0A316E5J4_9FLAO|nr:MULTISPECIES: fluoride efflux transporter CrcB [Maribacter]MBD0779091.1 fluoride efflux transporter CrcB [Maribacter aquimaris]MBD1259233.1 fluoride efflux transporter CrcB [Maribacter polysiphoniae]PWK24792.1 camphor resistance protein CrcB [Maribacter polysiphoniae]
MKQLLLVFLGGGIGSMLRHIISRTFNDYFQHFYLGTFLVNIIGCLIIGLVLGLSLKNNFLTQNQTLLLSTGFCGGFTTFSSFAFENHSLIKAEEILHFSFYTISSITVGILAVLLGFWLSKLIH